MIRRAMIVAGMLTGLIPWPLIARAQPGREIMSWTCGGTYTEISGQAYLPDCGSSPDDSGTARWFYLGPSVQAGPCDVAVAYSPDPPGVDLTNYGEQQFPLTFQAMPFQATTTVDSSSCENVTAGSPGEINPTTLWTFVPAGDCFLNGAPTTGANDYLIGQTYSCPMTFTASNPDYSAAGTAVVNFNGPYPGNDPTIGDTVIQVNSGNAISFNFTPETGSE
jgi:hypothetical protein